MKRTIGFMLVSLLVSAPVVAQGPGMGPPQDSLRGPRNPIAALLGHREALELTDEQVTELESIQAKLEAEVAPLRARLEELHGEDSMRRRDGSFLDMTQAEREALIQRREEARPVALQLMGLNRAAGVQAHEVLDPGQRALLMQFMRRGAGIRGAGMPGRGMRGPGMRIHGMRGPGAVQGARGGMGRGIRRGPPPGSGW